jgi:hypothetical protein
VQLSAVILARVLAFVETFDLGQGKVFFPEITPQIVDRYKFQKFPQTLEQFDESKGVEFLEGKIGNNVIQKLGIWDSVLTVETRTNTTDSKRILEEMLQWGSERFGLNYKPGTIKRFAYISDLTFYSDVPILSLNPSVANFADKLSKSISDIWQEPIKYEPMNFQIGHDPLARKNGIAPFSIIRRAQTRFSENKYFSEAPLPTDAHVALLEEFEAEVKRMHGARQ